MYFPSGSWGMFEVNKPNKNEKVLKRIRLLYNLSLNGGDPTSNEAQSAMSLAHKLIRENDINEDEI